MFKLSWMRLINPGWSRTLDAITLNEVQLVLAEKRTALSTMRTGIAIFAFPLSVLSVLIATSPILPGQRGHALAGARCSCSIAGLVILGVYLIVIAIRRIRRLRPLDR